MSLLQALSESKKYHPAKPLIAEMDLEFSKLLVADNRGQKFNALKMNFLRKIKVAPIRVKAKYRLERRLLNFEQLIKSD